MIYRLLCIIFAISVSVSLYASTSKASTSQKDNQIVGLITIIDQHEINAGKIAENKATNEEVKEYARMMVDVHTQNLSELKELSKQEKLTAAKSSDSKSIQSKSNAGIKRLANASSKEFDSDYIDAMVSDHSDALKSIDKSLSNVTNANLKIYLQKTLDAVKQHLEEAKNLQKNLE